MEKVTEATLHLEKVTEATLHLAKCSLSLEYLKATKESKDPVLFHPIPLLEIFLFFEIWHFLIKSSNFGDWAHQGEFLC